MKSYTIHLIRHGISQGNLLGQYIGITDSPLSKEGKEQLKQLAEQNSYPYAQAYYTSPLSRCVDSLNLIYPNAEPKVSKNAILENGKENQQKIWNMTPILSNGWKAVPPCLRPEEKMEATLCSASVWSLKHLWNV